MAATIREKRYRPNPTSDLALIVETPMGARLSARIDNISASGMAVTFDAPEAAELVNDDIIPSAKLQWKQGSQEAPLGRLNVIRTSALEAGATKVALSLIDGIAPLTGALAFELDNGQRDGVDGRALEIDPDLFTLADLAQTNPEDIDLFSRFRAASTYRQVWLKKPIYLFETYRVASKGTRVKLQLNRKTQRPTHVMMASNDYLGLGTHPEVIEAAKKALDDYGFGATGSMVLSGRTALHEELREFIARLFKKDSAILFPSGYQANVGAISAVIRPGDFVVADHLSHASIHDALQMCKGTVRFFRHNDVNHLRRLLQENRESHRGCLIVTESVFSMDGDTAALPEIIDLAAEFQARTYVDEAHAFGVLGEKGLGQWETLSNGQTVDLIMGNLSKVCGSVGGFIAGDQEVVDWMHFFARSQIFSTAMPPCVAAAALKALQLFTTRPEMIASHRSNIKYFVDGMRALGAPLDRDHATPIVPVIVGDEQKLGTMTKVLLDGGIYVTPVIYPAVSRNRCRFRFTVMGTHTTSDLDLALSLFEKAMKTADFQFPEQDDSKVVGMRRGAPKAA